jgi:polysaccharide pyruvyl transferase WcaK-like protein
VAMITLRGNPVARALLESVGVPGSRIRVTGDEAIELAYKLRPPVPGSGLGINFRLRTSAETSDQDLEKVRPVLHAFAREHGVPLIPVPIAVDPSTSDHRAVMQLLQGFDDGSDGGANLTSPRHVIEQVGRCRALVTCAYHAAVFALAQGIPVVGLVRSRYFAEKLRGLESQFGLGCQILDLEEPDLPGKLKEAIETAWRCAENSRLPLQQAAVRQIEAIWSTYYATRSLFPPR